MRDPLLEEANRAAHKGMREAKMLCGWLDIEDTGALLPDRARLAHERLHKAVKAYEEIERRQEKEATA